MLEAMEIVEIKVMKEESEPQRNCRTTKTETCKKMLRMGKLCGTGSKRTSFALSPFW